MARQRIAAGEIGQVQVTQLAGGKWRARARMRDDTGELVQLRADGATEDAARAELLARANALTTHTKTIVSKSSSIAEAAAAWLPTVRVRAENGTLSWSTYENYEHAVRLVLVPTCGGVTLEALTVGRCDRILQNLLAERGISAARKARSVLSLICGFAVRDDAIPTNPVRDVTYLPTPPKKTAMLTPEQIDAIRDLMTHWPAVMLLEETPRLHRIPQAPHTVAFGLSRRVPDNTPMVTFQNSQYSVPAFLLGADVFVRAHGAGVDEQVVIVHVGMDGPVEVARHQRAVAGSPAIDDAHFPDHAVKVPGQYTIKARSAAEAEFLGIGSGAHAWLLEAAAAGTTRMNMKMADAVGLAKISGVSRVDEALGEAATYGRFATGDLASILSAAGPCPTARRADEATSLAQGTSGWAGIGQSITPVFGVVATDDDDELEESA